MRAARVTDARNETQVVWLTERVDDAISGGCATGGGCVTDRRSGAQVV